MFYRKIVLGVGILFLAGVTFAGEVVVGASQTEKYLPLLKNKRVAVLANQTSVVDGKHIVDVLINNGIDVKIILSPEHGFDGVAGAGDKISDGVYKKVPIISLYSGSLKTIDKKIADNFDVLVIDIQDVGIRFYTYLSTMIKLMDAAGKFNKPVIILDRPNPNGFYIDGPILDMKFQSEISFVPIPIVHGMTLGELALMTNGQKWIKNICDLTIIKIKNWTHQTFYKLEIPPSPNLPNMQSIYLYASLCLFEGTAISVGRGTTKPFQVFGSPKLKGYDFSFVPKSVEGAFKPKFENQKCYGKDLSQAPQSKIKQNGLDLSYLIEAYKNLSADKNFDDKNFWTPYFETLVGVGYVREMIKAGKTAEEIKARWKGDVEKFKQERKPYLLYEE